MDTSKQEQGTAQPPSYNEALQNPDQTKAAMPAGYMQPGQPMQGYPQQGQPGPGYAAMPPAPPGYVAYPVYQQPGMPYGQTVQVVQTQPMLGSQPSGPPADHMCAAIFVTLCCFWPTGIIAIMKANDSRCAVARGDLMSAHLAAKSSKQMVNISIIVGIIAFVIAALIIGLYIGLVLTHLSNFD